MIWYFCCFWRRIWAVVRTCIGVHLHLQTFLFMTVYVSYSCWLVKDDGICVFSCMSLFLLIMISLWGTYFDPPTPHPSTLHPSLLPSSPPLRTINPPNSPQFSTFTSVSTHTTAAKVRIHPYPRLLPPFLSPPHPPFPPHAYLYLTTHSKQPYLPPD